MYDTARGLVTVAPQVGHSPGWGKVLQSITPLTGEVSTRHVRNTEKGLHLTLLNGITLMAERSLPKALHRTNVRELVQDEVPAALAVVDREIAETLEVDLPPLASWQPARVDYCDNRQIGSEDGVRTVIGQLRDVHLARKGRPVAGESGTSVAWGHGTHRVKVYGKLAESGESAATGVLRVEIEARRLSTFRTYLARQRGEPVQLLEVLTPEVREAVMNRFADVFERCVLSEKELTSLRFAQEFVNCFPSRRAFELIGFCVLYRLAGYPSAREVRSGRTVLPFSKSSVYRALADLRRFRHHLVEQGYTHPITLAERNPHEEGLDELADELVLLRRVADLAQTGVAA